MRSDHPGVLVGIVVGLRASSWVVISPRVAVLASAAWLAAGLLSQVGNPVIDLARGEATITSLTRLGGVPIERDQLQAGRRNGAAVRRLEAQTRSLLLLLPEAASLYLLSGTRVDGPYDFPSTTLLSEAGEAGLVSRIRRGDFDAICLRDKWPENGERIRPRAAEEAVRETRSVTERLDFCDLYR